MLTSGLYNMTTPNNNNGGNTNWNDLSTGEKVTAKGVLNDIIKV